MVSHRRRSLTTLGVVVLMGLLGLSASYSPAAAQPRKVASCDPLAFATKLLNPPPYNAEVEIAGQEFIIQPAKEFGDLDGDGTSEHLVAYEEISHFVTSSFSTGGSVILKRVTDGSCFQVLYNGSGTPTKVLSSSTNGLKDLDGKATAGRSGVAEVTLQFIDNSYKIRKIKTCRRFDETDRWGQTKKGGACDASTIAGLIEKTEAEEKAAKERAENARLANVRQSLPGLFTKCAANKARIVVLKRQGMSAARSGDQAGAQAAMEKLRELEPSWNDTLDKIRGAISTLTDDEGPEFRKLIMRVKRECST